MAHRFLQLAEVCEVLNISSAQAYALVRSGDLPAIKIGGRGQWRVEASELEAYIQRKYSETREFVNAHPYRGKRRSSRRPRPPEGPHTRALTGRRGPALQVSGLAADAGQRLDCQDPAIRRGRVPGRLVDRVHRQVDGIGTHRLDRAGQRPAEDVVHDHRHPAPSQCP